MFGQIKHLPALKNCMASTFLHPKYKKLSFSVDKINKIIHEFFDYIFINRLNGTKLAERKS